jgi:hypothetical protein
MSSREEAVEEGLIGEILYNGDPIDWSYWADRTDISPRQAAILAHGIDPILWPDGSFRTGKWPENLRIRIQRLYEWLKDRADSYTFLSLHLALGEDYAPEGMNQIAESMRPAMYEQQEEEKRKAGRYTLEDAAKLIAESGETSEAQMLAKLETAAGNHALPTYLPGHNSETRYGQGPGRTRTVSTFYDECYWEDLNKWLDVNDKRLTFRFSEPQATLANNATKPKARNTWTDSKLKALRQEHKEGLTHDDLAEKHGCSRQNISKYLKKAEEKFGRQKAGHFDAVTTWGKKK